MGAGLLIASPVKPSLPELPDPVSAVRSVAVELSAAVSPFVVTPTASDASSPAALVPTQLGALPDPAALLAIAQAFVAQFGQALADAPAQLQLAVEQIMTGQITQALNTAVNIVLTPVTGPVLDAIFSGGGPLVDLVDVLQPSLAFFPPLANVVGLLKNPDFLLTIGLGPLQSIYSLNTVIGGAAETVLNAVKVGDLGAAVNGIVKGLVDLQGTIVTQLFAAGTGPYYYDRGLVGSLIAAGQMIIDAFTAPAATTAATTADLVTAEMATAEVTTGEAATPESVDTADAATPASTGPAAAESTPEVTAEPAPEAADVVAAVEPTITEPTAAEQVTAAPVVEQKPSSTPEVRTGLVAVPGEVTVGVAKDEAPSATTVEAEEDSTKSDTKAATAGASDSSGSTAASDSGSAAKSDAGSDAKSDGGSGSDS